MTFETDTAYEECMVTFLDVLGFRHIMNSRTGNEVARILNIFRDSSTPEDSSSEFISSLPKGTISEVRAEIISDAVVRIRTTETEQRTGPIVWEIIDLVHIQMNCIKEGILIRGAATLGHMHLDVAKDGPVFGPGLVEAYQMEENEVHYPRIAVNEGLVNRHREDVSLWKDGHSYDDEAYHLKNLLTQDEAGLYYIDYLWASRSELEVEADWYDLAQSHRTLIERELAAKHPNRINRKYVWLKNYHNKVVKRVMQSCRPETSYYAALQDLRIA
tara:strand:- start:739 stop:1557 length:819 start_codon:yes stop_codon:yes gene_type:complete